MEEHSVVASLQHSRARIRGLLLPGTLVDGVDDDVFPRSQVMRFAMTFLLDQRKRGLALALITALMFVARRTVARGAGTAGILQSCAGLLAALRR